MDDAAQVLVPLDESDHTVAVGDVQFGKGKAWKCLQLGEPRLFETHLVIIVEIIDPYQPLASLQQPLGDMKTDESGSAGDKNRHRGPFALCCRMVSSLSVEFVLSLPPLRLYRRFTMR